jgi:hypothetical protein
MSGGVKDCYVGLSEAQMQVIMNHINESRRFAEIPKNVGAALVLRGIFTADGQITPLGESVAKMITSIDEDEFIPPAPALEGRLVDLAALNDLFKIRSLKRVKELGLASVHLKVLRMLIHRPGYSIFHLGQIFPESALAYLITRGLISRPANSHQIFPSDDGVEFIRTCINEVVGRRNDGKWAWVCRTCERQYPDNGDGLSEGRNASGHPVKLCECGGVVDLSPTKKKGIKNG